MRIQIENCLHASNGDYIVNVMYCITYVIGMHNINVCLHTFYQSVRSVRLVSGSHIESISASLKLNGKYTATQWMPWLASN